MEKDILLYVIVLFAVIVFSALILLSSEASIIGSHSGGASTTITATNKSTLTITASGVAYSNSSQALIYLTINGTGPTNGASIQNLSNTTKSFNSTIFNYINGNLSQISTNYVNSYKAYNKSGYVATETLTVTLPNIKNVSPVISALSNIPNIYVTDAQPILSQNQIKTLRSLALSSALSNATYQADALIGSNNTIYSTNITVNSYDVFPYHYYGIINGGSPASAPSNTTITPQFYGGVNNVAESITVIFSYAGK